MNNPSKFASQCYSTKCCNVGEVFCYENLEFLTGSVSIGWGRIFAFTFILPWNSTARMGYHSSFLEVMMHVGVSKYRGSFNTVESVGTSPGSITDVAILRGNPNYFLSKLSTLNSINKRPKTTFSWELCNSQTHPGMHAHYQKTELVLELPSRHNVTTRER